MKKLTAQRCYNSAMNTRKITLALPLTLLMASPASAADLRLYPDFAEISLSVRAKGDAVQVQFDPSQAVGLRPESIHLSGLPFSAMRLGALPSWLEGQVGKSATLQELGRPAQQVTIARVEEGQVWVRERSGAFKAVEASKLAFTTLPPEQHASDSGVQATFQLQPGEANSGELSYTNDRIGWTPRYVMGVDGKKANLEAWAHITNSTPVEQHFSSVELFAGEVNTRSAPEMYAMASAPMPMADAAPSAARVMAKEVDGPSGIYRYELDGALTLPKNSLTVRPFMTTQINEFAQVGAMTDHFNPHTANGNLQRVYRLVASDNLPAGVVAVREDGRLVGEAELPQTAAGEKAEFSLGNNPNALYERRVRGLGKRQYEVSYTFTNRSKHALPVEAKVMLSYHEAAKMIRADKGVSLEGGQATLRATVPAGEKVTLRFSFALPESE